MNEKNYYSLLFLYLEDIYQTTDSYAFSLDELILEFTERSKEDLTFVEARNKIVELMEIDNTSKTETEFKNRFEKIISQPAVSYYVEMLDKIKPTIPNHEFGRYVCEKIEKAREYLKKYEFEECLIILDDLLESMAEKFGFEYF